MYKNNKQAAQFDWAVGFENTFIPQSRPGLRALEEYDLMQHYTQWREDLRRAAFLGVKKMRWGVPWYLVESKPGQYDWTWVDQVLDLMIGELAIDPIIDLIHYGTPLWMDNSFIDDRYVESVTAFQTAFAQRYGHMVKFYTALNEPTVNAEFSGRHAQWPPYLSGESGYVKVMLQLVRGQQQCMHAISAIQKDAVFVAVEAMHHFRPLSANAEAAAAKAFLADMLSFDLVQGKVDSEHLLYSYLIDNGATSGELDALRQKPAFFHIFGLNFYPWSAFHVSCDDGQNRILPAYADGRMLADIIAQCHKHSGLPIFITETSAVGYRRLSWLAETTEAVRGARAAGFPVIGYTWFPMFSMINWDYRNSENPLEEHLLHLGLWDVVLQNGVMVRQETALIDHFRTLVQSTVVKKSLFERFCTAVRRLRFWPLQKSQVC